MSRVSAEYGRMIKSFLERNHLTFRAAAFGSGISAAYWKDMSDGRVPSDDVISQISKAYEDLNENELRVAAGYGARMETMDPVTAVEFALRGQESIPDEGKQQIINLVKQIQKKHAKKDK